MTHAYLVFEFRSIIAHEERVSAAKAFPRGTVNSPERSEVHKFVGAYVNRSGAKPREFERQYIFIFKQ